VWSLWKRLRDNHRLLKRELDVVATELEALDQESLRARAESDDVVRLVDGRELRFWLSICEPRADGELEVCIDADGLPTWFGVKPSYHFFKRADGSVYY